MIRVRFPNAFSILGGNADRHLRTHNANRKHAGGDASAIEVPLSGHQMNPIGSALGGRFAEGRH